MREHEQYEDALDHAIAWDDAFPQEQTSEDVLLGLGFNCTTSTDAALTHPGMLNVGLAMQQEFDNE